MTFKTNAKQKLYNTIAQFEASVIIVYWELSSLRSEMQKGNKKQVGRYWVPVGRGISLLLLLLSQFSCFATKHHSWDLAT